MSKISFFWFRRDLRTEDNTGLFHGLQQNQNVQPIFIFDRNILDKLEDKDDARVSFIHSCISNLKKEFQDQGGDLWVLYGRPEEIYKKLISEYDVDTVFTNRDYEPYAKERDQKIDKLLDEKGVNFLQFKDQLIFEPDEIVNGSGEFYKVYTPFSRQWKAKFDELKFDSQHDLNFKNLRKTDSPEKMIELEEMGFEPSKIEIPSLKTSDERISKYDKTRNFPAINGTTRLGIHLRFGTISIRNLAQRAKELNETYLNELIWREFYMMILAKNPQVVDKAFKPAYDQIPWRNDEAQFEAWCEGKTGYPIVDAGMRELNETGYMHNRVRMVVASFLTKHLLIDWRWGEAYFARKLLDYELASNNGGWQWAAGTGTDAQPYFRVFNPTSQMEKFDKDLKYVKKWVPEYGTDDYPEPIVDHKFARQRAIDTYKEALDR
ncbi:cryptochrome/photolyase family protein [Algoriphagus sediminis]|uniref:Deoxyribodipyrimidine photo-lyase n=1 Tax=Algoriphagus sediminis TaxID=3057113 RepID=A0ABT7Y8Z2_9BACT|nr:deoxyribodipyrimidine photo-lyase [Algoriphagus sediminis]MDN3202890.1 deoxyribodipyrimidine photo-lyase [Algoriphagus sediminis]